MFSNFKDTFIRKPQYTSTPPKAVIDAISKDLPEGFNYVYEHDGLCRLEAPNGFNIESGKVILSEDAKSALSDNPTMEQIKKYSYNSQTDIVFSPDEDGCFKIDGEYIRAEDIVKAPLRNLRFDNMCFHMKPMPFPQPFEMVFSGNGYNRMMHIHRAPHKSLNVQRYESVEKEPLSIVYYMDLKENKFTITFNLNIKNAESVYDVVSSYGIYNAFMDGNGEIAGAKFSDVAISSEKKISQETIDFWEKLYELEKFLEITFNITDGITVSDARSVEEIYRCLLKKQPYKSFKKYNSVKGKGIPQDVSDTFSNTKEIYFEFVAEGHYELLGQTIELKGVFGIFGASIKNEVPVSLSKDDEFEIMLQTAEGKRMYESVMLFLTDKEVEEFRKNKEHIEIMENAEEIISLE